MKLFNKSTFFKFLICGVGLCNSAWGHILFVNINENHSELVAIQAWVAQQNKNKDCSRQACEKLLVIPKQFPSTEALDSGVLLSQLNEALQSLEGIPGVIDKVIISGHSDGHAFSGQKGTYTEPNYITVKEMADLFTLTTADSGYLEPFRSLDFRAFREKFRPHTLLLMGCYSMRDEMSLDQWFSATPILQTVIGTNKIWPLGSAPQATPRIKAYLNFYSQSGANLSSDVFQMHANFRSQFARLAYANHDIGLAYRRPGSPTQFLQFNAVTSGENIEVKRGEIVNYHKSTDVVTDLYLRGR